MEAQKKLKGKADCVEAAVAAETETNTTKKRKQEKFLFSFSNFLEEKLCGKLKNFILSSWRWRREKGNKENVSTYFKVKHFEPKQEGELEAVEGFTRDIQIFACAKLAPQIFMTIMKFFLISLSVWNIFRSIKMSHTHGCMITEEEECVKHFFQC